MTDPDDITQVITDDHERIRRTFTQLDELRESASAEKLATVWNSLAELLDLHAAAEEEIFYPWLLRKGDDARAEILDPIGDHNGIRDAVRDAHRHPVGGRAWWASVGQARKANDKHMAEEEREALVDFRRSAGIGMRVSLGLRFRAFVAEHADTRGISSR